MSDSYVPELGQALFGNPTGYYAVSELGSAAIAALLDEVRRVFWNRTGREIEYQSEADADEWNRLGSGVEWHAYWWGEDDAAEAVRPNLVADSVAVRWYKYPGRGESVGASMDAAAWEQWLENALLLVRATDVDLG